MHTLTQIAHTLMGLVAAHHPAWPLADPSPAPSQIHMIDTEKLMSNMKKIVAAFLIGLAGLGILAKSNRGKMGESTTSAAIVALGVGVLALAAFVSPLGDYLISLFTS